MYIKQKPCKILARLLRKLGDSNPRYGYPYVSLANWWFQPLTQTSFTSINPAFPLKCGANVG